MEKENNFIIEEDESYIMVCEDMYVWKRKKNFIIEEDESYIMVCEDMYVWKRKKTSSLKRMNCI